MLLAITNFGIGILIVIGTALIIIAVMKLKKLFPDSIIEEGRKYQVIQIIEKIDDEWKVIIRDIEKGKEGTEWTMFYGNPIVSKIYLAKIKPLNKEEKKLITLSLRTGTFVSRKIILQLIN